jgi:hypothetical protein
MFSTLAALKARLALDPLDPQYDALLTGALTALGTRFEKECNRLFARAELVEEFPADTLELRVTCYPIESVSNLEVKSNETDGWVLPDTFEHLVRGGCVISLARALGDWRQQLRLTYIGGYVMPGDEVGPGQLPLPADLEQAALEQSAYWFRHRDKLGLLRSWPHDGTFEQLALLDLLPPVKAVLRTYERLNF